MPRWRGLLATWPHARLEASGEAVGLPAGQMGNSEVGHLNLGAGRPVLQDLPRIDAAIADGSFHDNAALLEAVRGPRQRGAPAAPRRPHRPRRRALDDRHAVAIAELAARARRRATSSSTACSTAATRRRARRDGFIAGLRGAPARGPSGGAHRDDRRPLLRHGPRQALGARSSRRYDAIVHGRGLDAPARRRAAIAAAYARGENDEFVQPTVIDGVDGRVRDGDVVVHFNFRADRARQLTHALVDGETSTGFDRGRRPRDLHVVTHDRVRGRAARRGRLPA